MVNNLLINVSQYISGDEVKGRKLWELIAGGEVTEKDLKSNKEAN